jgi:hypothetical protein
MYDG